MENSIMSIFMPREKNILYEAAMKSLKGMEHLIRLKAQGEDVSMAISPEKMFTRVYPKNPKSPAIFWIDQKQYLIYYPSNSTPYSHFMDSKCKFVQVLKGSLFDEDENMVLHAGDKLKIRPSDQYRPHTNDQECYIRVRIANCHSTFESLGL